MKTKKVLASLLLAFMLVLTLAGCDDLQSGYVYHREFDPGYSYTTPGSSYQTCTGSGSNRDCYEVNNPPTVTNVPPDYILFITSCSDLSTASPCKLGEIEVTLQEYLKFQRGDFYND